MTYSLNTLKNDPRAIAADGDNKPTGFRRFAQEIALTAGFVFMAFWLLALLTHSPLDPAWTTSGASGTVRNFGGRLGALFGDLSFFLLGYSVWWCYAAALVAWLAALANRLRDEDEPAPEHTGWRYTRFAFWAGLALLLISSTGLEWTSVAGCWAIWWDHRV
jgi:S-DNA-T family DNA segregation ATPase FtsK/SpoIIIE